MTIFSIFARRKDQSVEAVPDRFSWFAALLPPVFAIVHGLWFALLGYALAVIVLVAVGMVLGEETAVWLYVILAIFIGFEASTIRRLTLSRSGFVYGGERIADAEEQAAQSWLAGTRLR